MLPLTTRTAMGTLRTLAAGFTTGDLSPLGLRDLHYHMEAALADGACGVSLGLGYAPEIFYSTDGLIRALAPLHRSGVPICVHMRQEGDGVVDALREMIEVARALQTPLEVSHLKAIGGRNTRKAVPEMLSLIEKAREDVDGAYAAVNCEFARYLRLKYPNLRYLNREDDVGLAGLRKAKLSYNPHHMVEKSWAYLAEDFHGD